MTTIELNELIAQYGLPVQPFNEKNMSITPRDKTYCTFIFYDEAKQCLRYYATVCPLLPHQKNNAPLLFSLLQCCGPASAFPLLHLGFDYSSDYLWIDSTLPFAFLTEAIFIQFTQNFFDDAQSMALDIIDLIENAPAAPSMPLMSTPAASASTPTKTSASSLPSAEELQDILNKNRILWG